MNPNENERTKMDRTLRDILLEASDQELREALSDAGKSFDSLAAEGQAVVQRALSNAQDTGNLKDKQIAELEAEIIQLKKYNNQLCSQLTNEFKISEPDSFFGESL